MRRLLAHAPLSHTPERLRYSDPHVKVYALLQAHLSRSPLAPDLAADLRSILPLATRLLQVCGLRVSARMQTGPCLCML